MSNSNIPRTRYHVSDCGSLYSFMSRQRDFSTVFGQIPVAATLATMLFILPPSLQAAPQCPLSFPGIDAAKSEKLFLYFPTADDATFPGYDLNVSPARAFDVAALNPAVGSTAALRDRIYDVVADDYCEFNVQVLETTTNPATLVNPPPRRVTVAVGSDKNVSTWGEAEEVDTSDLIDIDFARVWGGTYMSCEGGNGMGGCTTGSLTGANATLDRWAQAIGGTAAHEAGHTYGLAHTDDDGTPDPCSQPGPGPAPGEDSLHRHLMPAGCNLSGEDRASYRRHFSDRTYGLLATNIGLSMETMHNWDLTNPNASAASSIAIDYLSPLASTPIAWQWTGTTSPWINPTVAGPLGTSVFKGQTYNRFRITWSTPNPAWSGAIPGVVPGGGDFHIGTTLTGVDINKPNPIIIQNVTLFDASSSALTLHPRLPMYDTGTLDSASDTFSLDFQNPPAGPPLVLQSAVVYQLPRVASIESLIGDGRPFTFNGSSIQPWSVTSCPSGGLPSVCLLAHLSDPPHVSQIFTLGQRGIYDCSRGAPRVGNLPAPTAASRDSISIPDLEGPICAGSSRDPFPATTVYIDATFVDPQALHFVPTLNSYITGPVTSHVFYQFAGIRNLRAALNPPRNGTTADISRSGRTVLN